MTYILAAMQREADSLGIPCKVIGIKATDLPETTEDDILVNVGYCGGYRIPVGSIVQPCLSGDYGTGETISLVPHFDCPAYPCFTADTFVTEPLVDTPAIYDMELWRLLRLPHSKLYCLKIVSDNLDERACEAFDDAMAWERIRKMLVEEKLAGR